MFTLPNEKETALKQNKDISFVFNISMPALAEITVMNLLSIMDVAIAGKLGGNICVASISISSAIINTIVSIFITTGICIGMTSLISRKIGGNKYEEAEEYASLGVFLGSILAFTVFIFIFTFCGKILSVAGAKGEILKNSMVYTKIFCFSVIIMMINSLFSSIFRAQGNTAAPFLLYVIIFTVKLSSWFLIYELRIFPIIISVAVSSIIGQLIGFIYLIFTFFYDSLIKVRLRYIVRFNKYKAAELVMLTIPSSLEDAAHNISRLLSSFIIIRSSSFFYAADQIANSIESISTMPAVGFGLAATTIAGINIGKNDKRKADVNVTQCAYISVMIMMFFSALFALFPNVLAKMFINKSEIKLIKYTALCLTAGSLEQPAIAVSSVYNGALKGIGDTKTPLFISMFTSWVIRVPLIYYFISVRHYSIVYVWWATAIKWAIDAFLAVIFLKIKIRN